jgi:hypothetical protein
MSGEIKVGDHVQLIDLPDWLIHDLPPDEKSEMQTCIGRVLSVEDIDDYGYYWLGFGHTTEDEQNSYYTGHSFCVSKECLRKI